MLPPPAAVAIFDLLMPRLMTAFFAITSRATGDTPRQLHAFRRRVSPKPATYLSSRHSAIY